VERLPSCAQVGVRAGEAILATSTGGGGYGDPRTRDPAAVAADVSEGWVSRTRAREVYGVELMNDGSVDLAGTALLRVDSAA
jgi:N-methylhydantoinase B